MQHITSWALDLEEKNVSGRSSRRSPCRSCCCCYAEEGNRVCMMKTTVTEKGLAVRWAVGYRHSVLHHARVWAARPSTLYTLVHLPLFFFFVDAKPVEFSAASASVYLRPVFLGFWLRSQHESHARTCTCMQSTIR